MNSQNFIQKFAKSKRPDSAHAADPSLSLNVEFRHKNQMVFCRDDFALDFCASYWPAALWTVNQHPEQRIMIATHRHDHAEYLMHRALEYIEEWEEDLPAPLNAQVRNGRETHNEYGGSLYFCTIGSAVAGRRFHQIVINAARPEPRTPIEQARYAEWLEQIPCRLIMLRPLEKVPPL